MTIAARFLLSFLVMFFVLWVCFSHISGESLAVEYALTVGRACAVGAIVSCFAWIWGY